MLLLVKIRTALAFLLLATGAAVAGGHPTYPALGSTYVPLESWVYPAFDRLAALGYAPAEMAGLRPWTRTECARLVDEAEDLLRDEPEEAGEARRLQRALQEEFAPELRAFAGERHRGAAVESLYVRLAGIAGPPLTDGYHFGQTLVNDYGRPYQRGLNTVAGVAVRGVAGRFSFYARGEYQHAPDGGALPAAATAAFPRLAAGPFPAVDRLRPLEAYVAVHLGGYHISFGRQSLWWGPGNAPLLFTNNAEPVTMLRVSRATPFKFPLPLSWTGPVRTEFFMGQLRGHRHINLRHTVLEGALRPQPFVHGGKISFKPTPNLEFGFSTTTIWGGQGTPTTLRTLWRSFSLGNEELGVSHDPGDRRSGFDFSYRLPGLRDRVLLYADSMSEDEFSPVAYPRRSGMRPGVYLARLPWLPHMDLRAEAVYTDVPGFGGSGQWYFNGRYLDGYTNEGRLMGHWVGRQGKGAHLATTWWFSPQSTLRVSYRSAKLSQQFLAGGGTTHNLGARADLALRDGLEVSAGLQVESWLIPLLAEGRQHNMASSLQITYRPRSKGD